MPLIDASPEREASFYSRLQKVASVLGIGVPYLGKRRHQTA